MTSSAKGFAVVRMEGYLTAMPASWLIIENGQINECWWPPAYINNIISHIRHSTAVEKSLWQKVSIYLIDFFDSYESASRYADISDYNSTDEHEMGSGNRRKYLDYQSSDDESDLLSVQRKRVCRASIEEAPATAIQSEASTSQHDEQDVCLDLPDTDLEPNKTCNNCEKVNVALEIMNGTLSQVLQELQALKKMSLQRDKEQQRNIDIVDINKIHIFEQFMPFKDEYALKSFDSKLATNLEWKSDFKKIVLKVGGRTAEEHTTNVCRRIYCDELAMKCSWFGQKQNMPIHNLNIMKLFKAVIINVFDKCTETDFQRYVSNWLRYARQRHDRSKQKE